MDRRSFLKGVGAALMMPALSGMTPQQLILLNGGMALPSWLDPRVVGNGFAYSFTKGQYWLNRSFVPQSTLLTVSRNSPAVFNDTAGVYHLFEANVPAITDRGFYPGGQFTNKISAYNFAPSLVAPVNASSFNALAVPGVVAGYGGGGSLGQFGIVADAAKVATTGLGAVANGNVFLVDMTGDTVGSGYLSFNDAVGNTNPHSWGAWARNDTVDATLRMVGALSYGTVALIPGAEYSFVKAENWTPDATAKFRPQIGATGVLRLFGMQLVQSSFLPPPIVTAGATSTRLADAAEVPNFAALAAAFDFANGFIVKSRIYYDPAIAVTQGVWAFGVDSGNYVQCYVASGIPRFRLATGAVTHFTLSAGTWLTAGWKDIECRAIDGAWQIIATDLAGASNTSSFALPVLSVGQIGRILSGTGFEMNGPIGEIQVWGTTA